MNNTEDVGLDEILDNLCGKRIGTTLYPKRIIARQAILALIQQEANRQKLEMLDKLEAIPNEVGKLANHSLQVSELIQAERKQLEGGATK